MEVAIASDSPLGRYLSALDSGHHSPVNVPETTLNQQQTTESKLPQSSRPRHWKILTNLFYRIKQRSYHRRIDLITSHFGSVFENLQLLLPHSRVAFKDIDSDIDSFWLHVLCSNSVDDPFLTRREFDPAGIAVIISFVWATWSFHMLQLTLLVLGAVELMYQIFVYYVCQTTRQLIKAVDEHNQAIEVYMTAFTASLDIVKRAELATRGYRLGSRLPPIGRLEEVSAEAPQPHLKLRCQRLRVRLDQLNDMMERIGTSIKSDTLDTSLTSYMPSVEHENDIMNKDTFPPSLLITSLQKRLGRVCLELETSIYDRVTQDLSNLVESPNAWLCFDMTTKHCRTLTRIWKTWARELDKWTSLVLRLSPVEPLDDAKSFESTPAQLNKDNTVMAISDALADFLTTCDTMRALVWSCQHDTIDSVTSERREGLAGQLLPSHQQMTKVMNHMHDDWTRLDGMVKRMMSDIDKRSEATKVGEESCAADQLPTVTQQPAATTEDDEREYLLVYKGTSIGADGFDLQSLLHSQRVVADSPTTHVTSSFIHELQNVLEQRQERELSKIIKVVKKQGERNLIPVSLTKDVRNSTQRTLMGISIENELLRKLGTQSNVNDVIFEHKDTDDKEITGEGEEDSYSKR